VGQLAKVARRIDDPDVMHLLTDHAQSQRPRRRPARRSDLPAAQQPLSTIVPVRPYLTDGSRLRAPCRGRTCPVLTRRESCQRLQVGVLGRKELKERAHRWQQDAPRGNPACTMPALGAQSGKTSTTVPPSKSLFNHHGQKLSGPTPFRAGNAQRHHVIDDQPRPMRDARARCV
jgi:hypothetical protein